MKNKIITFVSTYLLAFIVGALLFSTIMSRYADKQAKSAVYNSELISLVELALENDYDCQVENYKLFKKEELLVFNTDKGTYYFKPKKVAPFRYEWVEVEI